MSNIIVHWYHYNLDGINDDQVLQYRQNKILREVLTIGIYKHFRVYNIAKEYIGYGKIKEIIVNEEMILMNKVEDPMESHCGWM